MIGTIIAVLLGQQAPASRRTARRRATAPPEYPPSVSTTTAGSRMPSAVALPTIVMAGIGRTALLTYCCFVPLPKRRTVGLSVAGPGGLLESGPELPTGLSRPLAGAFIEYLGNGPSIRSQRFPHQLHASSPTTGAYAPTSNASTAILRTTADAGSERRANRPASSLEPVGHVLTCNVIGRSGMGVGFHAERR